jgi:hypothetical protein
MASILEDLEIVEVVLGDLAAFAGGQPVSTMKTIGSETYSISVALLPNGPVAPYTTIQGTFLSVLFTVLADATAVAAGAPLAIAVKENKSWYGLTLQIASSTGPTKGQ